MEMTWARTTTTANRALTTPWQESIELRRQWRAVANQSRCRGIDSWRADEVSAWFGEMQAEVDRYALAAGHPGLVPGFENAGHLEGADATDPREALVRLIAIAGAAIDAMGRDD